MSNHTNGAEGSQRPQCQAQQTNQQGNYSTIKPSEVQKDILIQLYSTMQKELRQLESHFIQLAIPLLTSLVVYGYAVKEFYSKSDDVNYFLILSLGYIASALICIFIYFVSNVFAYTYRQNQVVLSKIEDFCCLYSQDLLPPNFNLIDRVSCIDPPELYKLFSYSSVILLILISLHFISIYFSYCDKLEIQISLIFSNILKYIVIIFILIAAIELFLKMVWKIYKKKLEKLYPQNNQNNCQEDRGRTNQGTTANRK